MRLLILPLCLLVNLPRGSAQQIALPGAVVIQNSAYETGKRIHVEGAAIRAQFAKAVTSDKQGRFELVFSGVPSGASVCVNVEKTGMEVVNKRDVEQALLGAGSQLQVVLADTRKLTETQMKFYGIVTSSINSHFESHIAALQEERTALTDRLATFNAEMNDTLRTLGDALQALSQQREGAMGRAQELSRALACTDLDGASDLFLQAFEQINAGRIDSALILLDPERLIGDYNGAMHDKAHGHELIAGANAEFRQLFQCYALKENVLEARIDFVEAQQVVEHMLELLSAQPDAFSPAQRVATLVLSGELALLAGNYPRAESIRTVAMEYGGKWLRPDHPDLAKAGLSYARSLELRGELDSALAIATRSLSVLNNAFGPNHPDVAEAHQIVGYILRDRGAYSEAVVELLGARRSLLVDSLRNAVQLGDNNAAIGYASWRGGQLAEALQRLLLALEAQQAVHVPHDPLIARTLNDIALVLNDMGEREKAIAYLDRTLEIQMAAFGPEHPEIARTYDNFGTVLNAMRKFDEAVAYKKRGLEMGIKLLGELFPSVAMQYSNLAVTLMNKGDLNEGMAMAKKGLSIREKILPPRHRDFIYSELIIAGCYRNMGLWDSCLVHAQKALDLANAVLGPDHPDAAESGYMLGYALNSLDRYSEALPPLKRSLAVRQNVFGEPSIQVADVLEMLGDAYLNMDLADSSTMCYRRCLMILQADPYVPELKRANIACALSWAMGRTGAIDSALALIRAHIPLIIQVNKKSGRSGTFALTAYGWLLERHADLDSALCIYNLALGTFRRIPGASTFRTVRIRYFIGRTKFLMKDLSGAENELDSVYAIFPCSDVAWFRYRIAALSRPDEVVLDRLLQFLRSDGWIFGALSPAGTIERREALEALAPLGIRLHLNDLLKEFQTLPASPSSAPGRSLPVERDSGK